MESTYSHVGVCVSDLDRSLRFYCEALGFEKAESHAIGSEFAQLMDLPDVAVTSQFIRQGTTTIELLAFTEPAPIGPTERRPIHQRGLTHLSFRVTDLRATAALVVSIDIGTGHCGASSSRTGTIRRNSSSAEIGACPGRVDSPPRSMTSAPSSTMANACATACAGSAYRPPSENESGVTFRMPITSVRSRTP